MIQIGAEANINEIKERLRASRRPLRRPLTVHAILQGTIMGIIKTRKLVNETEAEDPRTAAAIANAWASKCKVKRNQRLTVWID